MSSNTPVRYCKALSEKYAVEVWLKLESFHVTGTHKDRESRAIIDACIKSGYQKIGCTSTGNYGVSLAYYSWLHGLECHVWLSYDTPDEIQQFIKACNAKLHYSNAPFPVMIEQSSNVLKKIGAFNANPAHCKLKKIAHQETGLEIQTQVEGVTSVVCPVNNGSLLLGLDQGLQRKIRLYGVTTDARCAHSIKGFYGVEGKEGILDALGKRNGGLVMTTEAEIEASQKLLTKEGIMVEPSSAAVVAALAQLEFQAGERVCCLLTGNAISVADPHLLKQKKRNDA